MSEPTLYRKCERCGGRAGWTEPNTLEWVECEADGCALGVVPVEPDAYVYRQGGLSGAFYRCEKGEADAMLFGIGGDE